MSSTTKRVLIADDDAIIRFMITGLLEDRGYEVTAVGDGCAALEAVSVQQPDLILLDAMMPGMNGRSILERIRREPSLRDIAVIMLTASNDRVFIERIAALGIKGYILKSSFEVDRFVELVERIVNPHTAALPATFATPTHQASRGSEIERVPGRTRQSQRDALRQVRPLVSSARVHAALQDRVNLRCVAPVAQWASRLARDPQCSADQIAKVVKYDPVIALEVMKLANASADATIGPVDTVEIALCRLGDRNLGELVSQLETCGVSDGRWSSDGLDIVDFREHAVLCGLIAADLMRYCGGTKTAIQSAYVAGLLHDVGRLVYDKIFPDQYTHLIRQVCELRVPLDQVERRALSIDHTQAMERVLKEWNLPPCLVEPISCHHQPLDRIGMIKEERLKPLALIGLADRLAHSLLLGDEATAMLEPTDRHCRVLKLDPRPMKQLSSRVQASVTRLKALTASWGFDSGEPAWRRRVREQLGENIRPLYISEEPAFDSHGWFFRQTCSYDPQQPPNLAVLLIDRQENRRLLHEDLLSAEQEAGVTRLPLLIFSESGELSLPGLTGSRRVCLLPSTVHVLDVSEAIAALLDACVGAA